MVCDPVFKICRFSSWHKVLRTTAIVLKVTSRLRRKVTTVLPCMLETWRCGNSVAQNESKAKMFIRVLLVVERKTGSKVLKNRSILAVFRQKNQSDKGPRQIENLTAP